jgi:hypothetical protein
VLPVRKRIRRFLQAPEEPIQVQHAIYFPELVIWLTTSHSLKTTAGASAGDDERLLSLTASALADP